MLFQMQSRGWDENQGQLGLSSGISPRNSHERLHGLLSTPDTTSWGNLSRDLSKVITATDICKWLFGFIGIEQRPTCISR